MTSNTTPTSVSGSTSAEHSDSPDKYVDLPDKYVDPTDLSMTYIHTMPIYTYDIGPRNEITGKGKVICYSREKVLSGTPQDTVKKIER